MCSQDTGWDTKTPSKSLIDALYFGTVVMSTVGYGDLTPEANEAKFVTVLSALVGICVVFQQVGWMLSTFVFDPPIRFFRTRRASCLPDRTVHLKVLMVLRLNSPCLYAQAADGPWRGETSVEVSDLTAKRRITDAVDDDERAHGLSVTGIQVKSRSNWKGLLACRGPHTRHTQSTIIMDPLLPQHGGYVRSDHMLPEEWRALEEWRQHEQYARHAGEHRDYSGSPTVSTMEVRAMEQRAREQFELEEARAAWSHAISTPSGRCASTPPPGRPYYPTDLAPLQSPPNSEAGQQRQRAGEARQRAEALAVS